MCCFRLSVPEKQQALNILNQHNGADDTETLSNLPHDLDGVKWPSEEIIQQLKVADCTTLCLLLCLCCSVVNMPHGCLSCLHQHADYSTRVVADIVAGACYHAVLTPLLLVQDVGAMPAVFTLEPGEFVHINKARQHAFRKKATPADETEEPCVSCAWDWIYMGASE